MYEALGLCAAGQGGRLIDSAEWAPTVAGGELCRMPKPGRGGDSSSGGWADSFVVNPSGGLVSECNRRAYCVPGIVGAGHMHELFWAHNGLSCV